MQPHKDSAQPRIKNAKKKKKKKGQCSENILEVKIWQTEMTFAEENMFVGRSLNTKYWRTLYSVSGFQTLSYTTDLIQVLYNVRSKMLISCNRKCEHYLLENMFADDGDATYLFCCPEGCLCLLIHFPNVRVLDWEDDKSIWELFLRSCLHLTLPIFTGIWR